MIILVKCPVEGIDGVCKSLSDKGTIISKDNIEGIIKEDKELYKRTLVVPGYLVKAGVPTCNTKVSLCINYLVMQSRLRELEIIFVAPSLEYLDKRVRTYYNLVV